LDETSRYTTACGLLKQPDKQELAKALQRETGETMTHAVTQALRERPERFQRKGQSKLTASELLAIGRRCASTLKAAPVDHGTLLYDERGIPR
jgi:antitoxin VapB